MNDRPSDNMILLAKGQEAGIDWCVCAAPLPGANGYVRLPEDHPWHGLAYDDIPIDAPGGFTFAGNGWVGFDTMHGGDHWPEREIQRLAQLSNGAVDWNDNRPDLGSWNVWSLELVIEACEEIAREVAAAPREEAEAIESIRKSIK